MWIDEVNNYFTYLVGHIDRTDRRIDVTWQRSDGCHGPSMSKGGEPSSSSRIEDAASHGHGDLVTHRGPTPTHRAAKGDTVRLDDDVASVATEQRRRDDPRAAVVGRSGAQ